MPSCRTGRKGRSKWKALGKKNGKLEFVVVQDSVQGFCAIADFVSDKEFETLLVLRFFGSSLASQLQAHHQRRLWTKMRSMREERSRRRKEVAL